MASSLGLIDHESQLQRSLKAKEKRDTAKKDQENQTEVVDGFLVRPALGHTGGAQNIGWELIPPKLGPGGPTWYLRSRKEALEAIPRHRARYTRG